MVDTDHMVILCLLTASVLTEETLVLLRKCSFEETTDQLFKASIFGELDKLNGVSSNIMMGQIPKGGTGESDILIDETKLEIPAETG